MNYGMYLSAAGVAASAYRQDVIANNLANAETVGFRRDVALFRQRLTAEQEQRKTSSWSDPLLEGIGGGLFAEPTAVDNSQGDLEYTASPLDAAIEGKGYFAVDSHGKQMLTRNGQFAINHDGRLCMADDPGSLVLDATGKPIKLDPALCDQTAIGSDGTIIQANQPVAKIGIFDVPAGVQLQKQGRSLLSAGNAAVNPIAGTVRGGFLERANVEPTTELTDLMETQRQLEANANMIHFQDGTMDKLVNTVGKIG